MVVCGFQSQYFSPSKHNVPGSFGLSWVWTLLQLLQFMCLPGIDALVTWGNQNYGGDSLPASSVADQLTNVDTIYSTDTAFAAKKADGTVVTWGDAYAGGDSSSVADQLTNVSTIYSTGYAFAAKKTDGTVVTWGSLGYVSVIDASSVADQLTNVDTIYSTDWAFAAKKADGTVVTWGSSDWGGNSSSVAGQMTNVDTIYSNPYAFAAKKTDGSVVTWGNSNYGGDSSSMAGQLTNVDTIYCTDKAFAAKKTDGTVVTWETGITVVIPLRTDEAFAAKKADGTVVTWGSSYTGGDSSSLADQLTNVETIYSTHFAFAAKKTDGTAVTWGNSYTGGDSSAVADQLQGVVTIYSTTQAFAAITVCSDAVDISGGCYKCTNNTCTAAVCKAGYVFDPSAVEPTVCQDCAELFPSSESVETCTSCDASTCKTGVCRAGFHSFIPGARLFCFPCATYAFRDSVANCTACDDVSCLAGSVCTVPLLPEPKSIIVPMAMPARVCAPGYFDFVAGSGPRCVGQCDELFSHASVLRCTTCSASRCEAGDCVPGNTNFSGGPSPTCAACWPGSFFDAAAHSCSPCPTGFFSNRSAQTACTLCAAGYFAARPGLTACSVCPEGHFCALPVLAAAPEPCPPGTYQPGGSPDAVAARSCLPCADGFESVEGAAVCLPVPRTFNSEALQLAAVCAGLLFLTALFVIFMQCRRGQNRANYLALFTPTLALFDVGTDMLFLADLVASQGWVAMAWAREIRSNAEFLAWIEGHITTSVIVILLSLANAEGLEVLGCKVGRFQALSAPFRSESADFLRVAGFTTNLLEDLPQLCIQVAVSVVDGLTTTRLVSFVASGAVIGKGLLTRSLNLIVQLSDRPEPRQPSALDQQLDVVDKNLFAVKDEVARVDDMIAEARKQIAHRKLE
eukprot:g1527.t1